MCGTYQTAPSFPAPGSHGMVTSFTSASHTHANPVSNVAHYAPVPSLGPNPTPKKIIRVSEYDKSRLQRLKIVDTPDMPYIAYRSWLIDRQTFQLESTGISPSYVWTTGINKATCANGKIHKDILEISLCSCGFYGLLRKEQILTWGGTIPGVFLAMGDTIMHRNEGLRAQKAQILCLVNEIPETMYPASKLLPHTDEEYDRIADLYRVTVVPYANLEMYVSEFGREVSHEN